MHFLPCDIMNLIVVLALLQILLTCVLNLKSFVIVAPGYLLHSTFSRTVPCKVYMKHKCFSPFSCQLHHIAFDGLKSHTLFPCPASQSINILLKFQCVFCVFNFTVANTFVSKMSYFRLNVFRYLHSRVLKELATELGTVVAHLFQHSLDTGEIPKEWSVANICPLCKKGDMALACNHRPVSLTCVYLASYSNT